jgi:hypothetical protein
LDFQIILTEHVNLDNQKKVDKPSSMVDTKKVALSIYFWVGLGGD